jgi:hypothetical protein
MNLPRYRPGNLGGIGGLSIPQEIQPCLGRRCLGKGDVGPISVFRDLREKISSRSKHVPVYIGHLAGLYPKEIVYPCDLPTRVYLRSITLVCEEVDVPEAEFDCLGALRAQFSECHIHAIHHIDT